MDNHTSAFGLPPFIRASSPVNDMSDARLDLRPGAGFLLAYVLVGVVSFLWAFYTQRRRLSAFRQSLVLFFTLRQDRLRGVQYMHTALVPLFFTDLVTAVVALVLSDQWLREGWSTSCSFVFWLWSISRTCGLVLHLSNALVCVLFLYDRRLGIKRGFIAPVLVLLIAVGFLVLRQLAVVLPGCVNLALTLGIIVQSTRTPPSPAAAHRTKQIVAVAVLSFLLTCAPAWVLQVIIIHSEGRGTFDPAYIGAYVTVSCATNANLMLDGLLCSFILKLPSEEEEENEREEQRSGEENTPPGFHDVQEA